MFVHSPELHLNCPRNFEESLSFQSDYHRSRPHYRLGPQALGDRPNTGLSRRRLSLADRTVDHPRAMGSAVGVARRGVADHSALRTNLRIAWASFGGRSSLA